MDDKESENEGTPLIGHSGTSSSCSLTDRPLTYGVNEADNFTNKDVQQKVIDQQQRIKTLERALTIVKKCVDQTSTKASRELSEILKGNTSFIDTSTRGLKYTTGQDGYKLDDDKVPSLMMNFHTFKNENGETPRYGNKFSKKMNRTIVTITIGTMLHSVFMLKQLLTEGEQACKLYWILVIILPPCICLQLAALIISGYYSKKSAKDPKQLVKTYEHSNVLMVLGAIVTLLNIVIGTLTYAI